MKKPILFSIITLFILAFNIYWLTDIYNHINEITNIDQLVIVILVCIIMLLFSLCSLIVAFMDIFDNSYKEHHN